MYSVQGTLLRIEQDLASASADAYRRHLAEEALVVIPGHVLDRDGCIEAIEQSPGWDEWQIAEPHALELGDDAAVLSYRWTSRRGDSRYAALMSSVYARRDGAWRLVLHQQTPEHG